MPQEFSWPGSLLTTVRQQNAPRFCDGAWAFATAGALSDRIKIARRGAGSEIVISPQVLLSCATEAKGCHGGSPDVALQYIKENGVTDETCSVYRATGWENGLECSGTMICKECTQHGTCAMPKNFYKYGIEDFGTLNEEDGMKAEIYKNGPIVCRMEIDDVIRKSYSTGVLSTTTKDTYNLNHDVTLTGWGVDSKTGKKYWEAKNSWGFEWGEEGFLRIERGSNT